MTTTAEQVAEILRRGLDRAEDLKLNGLSLGPKPQGLVHDGYAAGHAIAYGYLHEAVEAALSRLEAHVANAAYEDEEALRDDDRAAEGWR